MDFGRVSEEELNNIDFTLLPDPKANAAILKASKGTKQLGLYLGCAKWGRKDWIGKIYPPKTKEANFLSHYAKFFNSIELNATFYKIPDPKTVTTWREKAGHGFKFCPKFTDSITHMKRLSAESHALTNEFFKGIMAFEDSLGPCFIQLPPNFAPKSYDTLIAYLKWLPKDLDVFVELRHPGWFEKDMFEKVSEGIENTGKGFVITDASGRRDCVHMRLTNSEAFIRFVGNGLHPTDYTRVDEWVERLNKWLDKGLTNLYFFMHQHDELHSPELIKYVIQRMNERCKLDIPVPMYLYEEKPSAGLFD